jgi:hypothetical protein
VIVFFFLKVIKLGDKLYNLRDLIREPPASWGAERVQGYFVWGKKVTDNLRGTNASLEAALDDVFRKNFVYQGVEYPLQMTSSCLSPPSVL